MRSIIASAAIVVSSIACSESLSPTQPTSSALASATFSLHGAVYDTLGRTISNATVQVMSGPHTGSRVQTDDRGRFTFAETFTGAVTVRASKAGYRDETLSVSYAQLQNPHYTPWMKLSAASGTIDISGPLTVRVSADPACAASLPAQFRDREYTTTVSPYDRWFLASLRGGSFAASTNGYPGTDWNVVSMSFFGNEVALYMEDPPIQEIIASTDRFWIWGHAIGEVTGNETSLALTGKISYCTDGDRDCSDCQSSNHRLMLVRH